MFFFFILDDMPYYRNVSRLLSVCISKCSLPFGTFAHFSRVNFYLEYISAIYAPCAAFAFACKVPRKKLNGRLPLIVS